MTVCESDTFKVIVDSYGALTKRAELCEDWQAVSYLPLVERLHCPIQIHIGTDDEIISGDEVAELERLLAEHGKDYELYLYPGAHTTRFTTIRTGATPRIMPRWRRTARSGTWRRGSRGGGRLSRGAGARCLPRAR